MSRAKTFTEIMELKLSGDVLTVHSTMVRGLLTYIMWLFTFAEAMLYLCDFHREQAWERWVSKALNGVNKMKDEVLSRLRRVAHASCPSKYQDALKCLVANTVWKGHQKLQLWFTNTWLSYYQVMVLNMLFSVL